MIDNDSFKTTVYNLVDNIIECNDKLRIITTIEKIEKSDYELNLENQIIELEKQKMDIDKQNLDLIEENNNTDDKFKILDNGDKVRENYNKLKKIRRKLSITRKEMNHYLKNNKEQKINLRDLKKERRIAYNELVNFLFSDMNSIR